MDETTQLLTDIRDYLLSTITYKMDALPDYNQEPYLILKRITKILYNQ